MENSTKLFRKSPLGFNREDVINYIEKLKNDFYEYKASSEKTVNELSEKIKELENEICNKKSDTQVKSTADEIDFSSSVSQINEATDRLKETAEKICDDIGDFLSKALSFDKPSVCFDELSGEDKFDVDFILNKEFTSVSDVFESDENGDKTEIDELDLTSQFSQILNSAVVNKPNNAPSKDTAKKESGSILDGLLGTSTFSI